MKQAVLITGAGGYVGRQCVDHLVSRIGGERVIATDLREPPADQRQPGVTYLALDIRDERIADIFTKHDVGVVMHLASVVTPPKGMSRQTQHDIDVGGTRNVLAACVAAGVGKIIVTSSGAAYGYYPDNPARLLEDDALRGNEEFAYSDHKRQVEELLAEYREQQPQLGQLIFRVCTVLGERVANQITALFEQPIVLDVKEASAPFVFIWDRDVVECLVQGATTDKVGIYNLAADGTMSMRDLAKAMGKPYVAVPARRIAQALSLLHGAGLSQYGPEQVMFLRHRPVLGNDRLKARFGFIPRLTSQEVFARYRASRRTR